MILCSPVPPEWAAAHVVNNLATGLAYLAIMVFVILAPNGIVRQDYKMPFAVFIGACGGHHAGMALCAPPALQALVDGAMTLVSVLTGVFVAYDVGRDLLHRWRSAP